MQLIKDAAVNYGALQTFQPMFVFMNLLLSHQHILGTFNSCMKFRSTLPSNLPLIYSHNIFDVVQWI